MTSTILVIFVCFVALSFGAKPIQNAQVHFQSWMSKHNKVYDTQEEYQTRFANFQVSVLRIEQKNKLSRNVTYALNKFSDLSVKEFRATYLMKNPVPVAPTKGNNVLTPTVTAAPDTFDWRNQKVVSAVKDQGQCGSCWAFSVVENIESVWMLAHNMTAATMPALAPQQLVDCDDEDGGCNGGNQDTAYDYLEGSGLEKESDYPYRALDGTCEYKKSNVYATIKSWEWATYLRDETTLQQNLLSVGPLSVCVDASNWQDYSSGVMGEWDCCTLCQLDHCVQLVGYNKQSSPYWIVRNSWGTDWGMSGYIWVDLGHNTCGIAESAATAVL